VIIVDACVAVKWILPEQGSEAAMDLLRGNDVIAAPDLIRSEVAGAMTRRFRRGELSAEDAKASIRLWIEMLKEGIVQMASNLDDLQEAGNLALQLKHPIQDCLYLAVARRTSSRLITADKEFASKAASVFPGVELLGVQAAVNQS
jgi:predicted nucleic acid-binding protein